MLFRSGRSWVVMVEGEESAEPVDESRALE